MRNYFCGWYFRCQSDQQTLALIPSVHRTKGCQSCAIQLITDTQSFHVPFSCTEFQKHDNQIILAGNHFGKKGITLDIHTPALHAFGSVLFGTFTPIQYDIMGPFRYVPFMQCKHSVYSMRHSVDGTLSINGIPYVFQHAVGYLEGDRGYSFPRKYAWTQCSFSDGGLMLSVADIPFGGLRFTGIIGVILLEGKEYRMATYLGSKALKIDAGEIVIRQKDFTLIVKPESKSGHPLQAPVRGAMTRTIHEHPSCRVFYRFEKNGIPLLELDAQNAAFEYEY